MSHTATGEWQSFELRMRRRRAARLALRAEAAASAGFEDDARACLSEARTLAPELPEIAAAEAALTRPSESVLVIADPPTTSRSAFLALATACILLAAFVGGWIAYRDIPDVADALPAQVDVAAAAAQPATTTSAPEPVREPVPETVAVANDPSAARVQNPVSREIKPPESSGQDTPPPSVRTSESFPTLPDATPVAPPAPALPVEPPPVEMPAPPTAGLAATVLPTPSVDVKAPVVEMPQEPAVQAVLNRFASAYTALDADAAERVWPTVNRGALARAFDGLASQRVSLGDCRIDVTGSKARARCAGSATWSPKVGSGMHTESRVWTFDLVRVGAGWQILNARAQNK
jgi:hypothetical protein